MCVGSMCNGTHAYAAFPLEAIIVPQLGQVPTPVMIQVGATAAWAPTISRLHDCPSCQCLSVVVVPGD